LLHQQNVAPRATQINTHTH